MTDADQRVPRVPVAALLGAAVAYFVVLGVSFAVLPGLVKDRAGGGDAEVGLAFGAMGLGMLTVRPFTGYLGDRFGRRPVMITAALVIAGLQLAHVPAADIGLWALYTVRVLTGFAGSAMYVSQATVATELGTDSSRDTIFATFSVAVYVGFALGPLAGQVALDQGGYVAGFGVGAVSAFVAALLPVAIPETRPADADPHRPGARSLLHPIAARVGLVNLLVFLSFMGFNAFIVEYADSIGTSSGAVVLSTFAFSTLVVRAMAGPILGRADRRLLATSAMLMVALAAGILAAFPVEAALFVAAVVLAWGLAFNVPLFVLIAADSAPPAERSRVVATVVTFGDLANSFGAFVLGAVADATNYQVMYGVVGVGALVATTLLHSPLMAPVSGLDRRPPARAPEAV